MRYLSDFLGDIPEMLAHFLQMTLNFLYVCQSVSLLTSLRKSDKYMDISSSGSDIFLIFLIYVWDAGTLATNDSEFYVCMSVRLLAYIRFWMRYLSGIF